MERTVFHVFSHSPITAHNTLVTGEVPIGIHVHTNGCVPHIYKSSFLSRHFLHVTEYYHVTYRLVYLIMKLFRNLRHYP